jgi:hypothetical protein
VAVSSAVLQWGRPGTLAEVSPQVADINKIQFMGDFRCRQTCIAKKPLDAIDPYSPDFGSEGTTQCLVKTLVQGAARQHCRFDSVINANALARILANESNCGGNLAIL